MPWVAALILLNVKLPLEEFWKAPTATATIGSSRPNVM